MPASSSPAHRFAALDLLRGLAALAVVLLHVPHPAGSAPVLPHAYLAVDLFFVLSGFVVAHAYSQRLKAGMGVARFMAARLVRLYPLYLLAALAGAVLILDALLPNGLPARSGGEWLAGTAANLLFLPAPPSAAAGSASLLYPAVGAAWSLLWELAANLLFACIAPRLTGPRLALLLAAGLVLLCAAGEHWGSLDAGANWRGFWAGGARVLWGFFAGVALFRLYGLGIALPSVPAWALAAVMLAAFAPGVLGWGYDVAAAALLFPALVLLGARARLGGATTRFGLRIGALSYAVYVLQSPALDLLGKLSRALAGCPLEGLGLAAIPLCLGVTFALGAVATRRFDDPVRGWLRERGYTTPIAAARA